MKEDQRKWLLDLQDKGIKLENVSVNGKTWYKGTWEFKNDPKDYRIPDQPIHDIPDWRELCREMQSKGVVFENSITSGNNWCTGRSWGFNDDIEAYRIPQQPLPEWREETPHRELQVQWHEDMLHHLRTGDPMRMWEWKKKSDGTWAQTIEPGWDAKTEYRRKPRTITYWHCVVLFDGMKSEVTTGYCKDEVIDQNKRCKEAYPDAKFSPITETTVEMED